MISRFMAAGTLLLAVGANAQGVYRCGNTYSEHPCGRDAKQIVAPPVREVLPANLPPSAAVVAANLATCVQATRAKMKDPDAAQIRVIGRAGPEFIYRAGKRMPGVTYHLAVNGKNSYGGFTGEKLYVCGFDATEQTLIFSEETDRAPR